MLARVRVGLAFHRDQRSAAETTRLQLTSVLLNGFHGCGGRRSSHDCGVSAVALTDRITLLFVVPLALVLHFGVILPEERYLEAKFGEQYLALKRKVRRWI